MPSIPKRNIERYKKIVPKFQKILKAALDRDINEADTVSIIQDMLSEIFGFDKYLNITSEYAIRGTYCDLAIKIDEKIQFLIEVKAIGLSLKDNHLRQVINYGAQKGVQWVVITNGINWELHKILFERPIDHELVSSFNLNDINPKKKDDQEKLFLLSKKGLASDARGDYYERVQSVNRFVIGALILNESIINQIKRDIRKLATGIKVDSVEIEKILRNEVLKRDVIEGEDATKANIRLKKALRKSSKKVKPKSTSNTNSPDETS